MIHVLWCEYRIIDAIYYVVERHFVAVAQKQHQRVDHQQCRHYPRYALKAHRAGYDGCHKVAYTQALKHTEYAQTLEVVNCFGYSASTRQGVAEMTEPLYCPSYKEKHY